MYNFWLQPHLRCKKLCVLFSIWQFFPTSCAKLGHKCLCSCVQIIVTLSNWELSCIGWPRPVCLYLQIIGAVRNTFERMREIQLPNTRNTVDIIWKICTVEREDAWLHLHWQLTSDRAVKTGSWYRHPSMCSLIIVIIIAGWTFPIKFCWGSVSGWQLTSNRAVKSGSCYRSSTQTD